MLGKILTRSIGAFLLGTLAFFGVSATFAADGEMEATPDAKRFEFSAQKMGVPTRIVLYAPDAETAEKGAEAVWRRFDELNAALSDYDPESEIIQVCRKSAETNDFVEISADLRRSLEESRRYCRLTGGAFDATVGPIVKLWRRSRSFKELPPASVLVPAKKRVGLGVWTLDERGVKADSGVRFDVGGIAKGFALDEALKALQALGIESALIDSGGDLRLGAAPPGKDGWTIGIASLDKNGEPAFYKTLANVGVASSGDANRFVEIDGVRYSHIIDPRTGEPLTRRAVVSVIAPTATAADALASAVCVLGGKESLKLFEKLRKTPDFLTVSEAELTSGGAESPTELADNLPLEFLSLQVKDGVEPPYSLENVDVFSTSGLRLPE